MNTQDADLVKDTNQKTTTSLDLPCEVCTTTDCTHNKPLPARFMISLTCNCKPRRVFATCKPCWLLIADQAAIGCQQCGKIFVPGIIGFDCVRL